MLMLTQELQLMSRKSRVTSYDQLRLGKQDLLPDTSSLLDFQILDRKFLPFATIVSLAIFSICMQVCKNIIQLVKTCLHLILLFILQ